MKCKVCGKRFRLENGNSYLAQKATGITTIFQPIETYECFDCPQCGCQNFANIRMATLPELTAEQDGADND